MNEPAPNVEVDTPAEPVNVDTAPAAEQPVAAEPAPVEPAPPPTDATKAVASDPTPAATETDWRARMSGGDEKKLATLERYGSEQAVADALIAAQQKIRSGDMTAKLPDNPTELDIAQFRKDHGIPETYDQYEYKLPEGFLFGEEDKPILDNYLKAMHDQHATPDQINAMLNVYANGIEEQAVQVQEKDNTDREATEDALRAEYGAEYRANINMVQNFISTAPEDVQNMLMNGRGPDGTAFMNNPEMVRWLNGVYREVNPAASVVKMTGRDTLQSVQDELVNLKEEMDTDIEKWRKSPDKRARYQTLLAAQEKLNARKT